MQRRSRVLRVVSTVLSSALVASYATTGVGAFSVEQDFPSGQTVYYRLDQTVRNRGNDAILAVYAGDQAWEAHDLRQWTDLVNNDSLGGNRVVKFDPIDGPGDIRAQTWPLGCLATSPSCELEFDSGENWYYGTGDPGSRPDLRGVAAHEFGHWIGLDHSGGATGCPSPDFLASDNNAYPTMTACYQSSNPDLRTISQDDVNGFHVARQGSPLPTANDSFEYTASTYGWGYVPRGGGGVARICDGTSYHRSCRLQDTGVNTSLYQDMVSRGSELRSHSLFGRAWLRASSGQVSATVAVWNLGTGQVVRSKTCTIGTSWSECKTGTFSHSSGTRLRVEVYNNTGTNLNHDLVSLRW